MVNVLLRLLLDEVGKLGFVDRGLCLRVAEVFLGILEFLLDVPE